MKEQLKPATANLAPNRVEELNEAAIKVAAAAMRRGNDHRRNLGGKNEDGSPARVQRQVDLHPGQTPLAERKINDKAHETLDAIVVAGKTMIGVSTVFTQAHPTESFKPYAVRLSVLPFGAQLSERGSATQIAEVNLTALKAPRQGGGYIQEFETFDLGRDAITALTGKQDETMSSRHLRITIDKDASITVFDGDPRGSASSNGTEVITARDFDQAGFDPEGRQDLIAFYGGLKESTYVWDKASQGYMVIEQQ